MSWVLLRGLTREARHWGTLPDRLARALETHQVMALDLPGNGMFHEQASAVSVRGMVDFARHQLRRQGVSPPWNLMAMSLGGMVATEWSQRYPEEVARMVLINTSMRPFSTFTERLRPASWPRLAALAAHWHDAPYAERAIHRLTCQETALREADVATWIHIRHTAPVSLANAARQFAAAARFSCAPQAPPCPVLVLSSSADRLVDPRCSERLAAAWQATHQVHPWAGHDLPHDDAGWVCRRIAHWRAGT